LASFLVWCVFGSSTPWPNESCKVVDLSALFYCRDTLAAMTGHLIPESFNETQQDLDAHQAVFDFRVCPAFNLEFQCVTHFPRCINKSDSIYVIGMCTTSCLNAKRYQGGYCEVLDIDTICSNKKYFDPLPDCDSFNVDTNQPDQTWQYILGGVLGAFGLIALMSLLIGVIRAKRYKPDDDPVDFEDERHEAERVSKLREKATKLGSEYVDLDVQLPADLPTRRWTSAQEARDAAATRQRQATLVRELELAEIAQATAEPRETDKS